MTLAIGKVGGFHSLLNSNPASLETVKSLAEQRKLKNYVNLIAI